MSGYRDAASDDSLRVVLCNCPPDRAGAIATAVLQPRLAACVNIHHHVSSIYWWKDELQHEEESTLVIKTRASLVARVSQAIRENHPHDVPEIVVLAPTEETSADYRDWVVRETTTR